MDDYIATIQTGRRRHETDEFTVKANSASEAEKKAKRQLQPGEKLIKVRRG